MTKYIVKWSKEFIGGHMDGVWINSKLEFPTLESASDYVNFLHEHKTMPVDGSSPYLCHMARIVME